MTSLAEAGQQILDQREQEQADPPTPMLGPRNFSGVTMDQSPYIFQGLQEREVQPDRPPHPLTDVATKTRYGQNMQKALAVSPRMRRHWTPTPEHTTQNGFLEGIWESAKRDSFIGNTARWIDQIANNAQRNFADQKLIYDNREELLHGISPEYHEAILNAGTFDLAVRESQRIRHREDQIKREYNQSIGKSLVSDLMGFMIDPTNLLPGYGMLKGVSVARRMNALGTIKNVAASSKMQQVGALTAAGAFEEAIRMAPRFASDPTFEANNYMEGIAMSAAFSGFLPVAIGGVRRGIDIAPDAYADIKNHLHAWGVDVGVRQAMRFPSELKQTGFKDPGTALRKSKEFAQDRVGQNVHEVNARNMKKEVDQKTKDLKGETPNSSGVVDSALDMFDRAGDAAIGRVKVKLKRGAQATAATAVTAAVAGPVPAAIVAGMFANRDYLAIALKAGVKAKRSRRAAYDLAKSTGDEAKAAEILREARQTGGKPTAAQTAEAAQEMILDAVEKAKIKIRDIHAKASTC